MAGVDTAVFNGTAYEERIEANLKAIIKDINSGSRYIYELKPQYSYSCGCAKLNKSGKRKIDFAILKNSVPIIFIELKTQFIPGTVSEKLPMVYEEFKSLIKEKYSAEQYILLTETSEQFYGYQVFNKMLQDEKDNDVASKITHFNNKETEFFEFINNYLKDDEHANC